MDALDSIAQTIYSSVTQISSIFYATLFGVALWQYTGATLTVLITLFAKNVVTNMLERFSEYESAPKIASLPRTVTSYIIQPVKALVVTIGYFLAARILLIPTSSSDPLVSSQFMSDTFQIATASLSIWLVLRLIDGIASYTIKRSDGDATDVPIVIVLRRIAKAFIFTIGALIVIERMGYPTASLLGGLGIGGLAIALAAQETVENVFGSLFVFTDKPFRIGEWVKIDDVEGFVEFIGLRTTKIRTWPKSLVTIPNKVLTNTNIENWSAMPMRRVSFTFPVASTASVEQLEQFVARVRELIQQHDKIDQSFYVVGLSEFSEKGYGVEVYYFTSVTGYADYAQVREEINFQILKVMDELGLRLGVPQRIVQLDSRASSPDSHTA